MARRRARIDSNQPEIVKEFRKHGCTVQHLHMVGGGCPDILVGYNSVNYLIEIKDGSKFPSERKLTPDEKMWHDEWLGSVYIIETIEDVELFLLYNCKKFATPQH